MATKIAAGARRKKGTEKVVYAGKTGVIENPVGETDDAETGVDTGRRKSVGTGVQADREPPAKEQEPDAYVPESDECEDGDEREDGETATAGAEASEGTSASASAADTSTKPAAKPKRMSKEERAEARAFGERPDLVEAVLADYDKVGLVGEKSNKLVAYTAMTSRKLGKPLSLINISSSGSGKSVLQDATIDFCPQEQALRVSALTGKALGYLGQYGIKHKVLAVAEAAGIKDAYQLRTLISEGYLATQTVIQGTSGKESKQFRVEGPTAVFTTSTKPGVDPELASRTLVTGIDESRAQTRRIQDVQRHAHTLEGIKDREARKAILQKHRNFQRLLKTGLRVVNPLAEGIRYEDDRLVARRNLDKYLNLCDAVAFLHQMSKTVRRCSEGGMRFQYIEVDERDVRIATEMMVELYGKKLDELSKPGLDLLYMLHDFVCKEVKDSAQRSVFCFTRRQIMDFTGWSTASRLHTHLKELVAAEYVVKAGKLGGCEQYRLLWDGEGKDGARFVIGLKPQKK